VEGVLQINNVYVLLVCRIFQGIFSGLFMAITPIYIYELAPKQIVGSYGALTQVFVVTGFVTAYALGLILQTTNASPFVFYRVMVSANALLIIIQSVLLIANFIPESPCSLIRRNRGYQAKEIIALFTKEEFVETAYEEKRAEVRAEE
jgi:MFS family permease